MSIRDLRRQGVGIIYISHRLEEIFAVADRVTVLRDGESVATHAIGEIDKPKLIRLMVGREVATIYPPAQSGSGRSRAVAFKSRLHNISGA